MSSTEQQLRDALRNIASIIEASEHLSDEDVDDGHVHNGHGHRRGGGQHGPDAEVADIGCVPKQLPKRLLVQAAQTATRINPANGLNLVAMASLGPSSGVMDPLRIAVLTAKYWGPKARQLTVSFMEATPADLRARIVRHLNAWNRSGGISFVETRGVGQVRISRGGGGYWSYLGTDVLHIPRNQPTMNLESFTMNTPEGEYRRVIRHEAGHTLGFPHEHMRRELVARIDPEKAYAYFERTQGWDRNTVKQQVLTSLDSKSIMGTQPDEDSIMCYQLPGSITRDGVPIKGGLDINVSDEAFCARIYPKAGSAARTVPDGHDAEEEEQMSVANGMNVGDWDPRDDVQPDEALLR
jgi:hypothetical protein